MSGSEADLSENWAEMEEPTGEVGLQGVGSRDNSVIAQDLVVDNTRVVEGAVEATKRLVDRLDWMYHHT